MSRPPAGSGQLNCPPVFTGSRAAGESCRAVPPGFSVPAGVLIAAVVLSACAGAPATQAEPTPTEAPPSEPPSTQLPANTPIPTHTATLTPTGTPLPSPVPSDTAIPTSTATPLPAGWVPVPDVIGMHYQEARTAVLRAGLNFVYRDVFDLALDTGTVLIQDPLPGTGRPRDSLVFLYRTFKAPPAIVGEICYPLRLIAASGKLLFWVDLEEDTAYEIRTDFPYGETQISDTQMFLLASFQNSGRDSMLFTAPYSARYVISLGPYSISEDTLEDNPSGVDVGCLWVIPQEG